VKDVAVFVTAGSQEKIDFCRSLGAKAGFNYKEGNWKDALVPQTRGGQGFDVILDPVGQNYFQSNLDALRLDGKLVMIGFLSGAAVKDVNLVPILHKRLTIRGSQLRARTVEYKSQLVSEFARFSAGMFESRALKPIVSRVLPWKEVAAAHRLMEEDKNIGKIVLNGMDD